MPGALPETVVITYDAPNLSLEIEQVAELSDLALSSMTEGTDPYWAYLWPSAKAMLDVIANLPSLDGKRVIDLGCGLGALGVAAAKKGANVVLADIREESIELAMRNAKRNGVTCQPLQMDFNAPPEDLGKFDGIVAADVLYADGMLRAVVRFIKKHLAEDGLGVITDPMRIAEGGLAGACRLHGLDVFDTILVPGQTLTGGVVLYEIQRRRKSNT